ncbi:MAG: FAD-binding oxidoreductase [Bacteroidota bacterium]
MKDNSSIQNRLSWWESEYLVDGVDYTIIGAGIVGISTAIELKSIQPELKVLVLDKKTAPMGASTKNAGFACFGSISEIWDDFNNYGESTCRKLIEMRWKGLTKLKSRIPLTRMYYSPKPGSEIFDNEEDMSFYQGKIAWSNALTADILEHDECYHLQSGAFGEEIINKLEGSLNPQKMMNELEAKARNLGVIFMFGIEIQDIQYQNKVLESSTGNIGYDKLIVCTNGFSNSTLPQSKVRPARNQVLITNKMPGFELKHCYHMNKGYVYFRSYNERLLIGGGRDLDLEGETTVELGTTELITSYLKEIVKRTILKDREFRIAHTWSGILGVGDSKMPIVKFINPDVLVAIRMGGMGVAIGSYIGEVAASMVLSIDNTAHQLYVS